MTSSSTHPPLPFARSKSECRNRIIYLSPSIKTLVRVCMTFSLALLPVDCEYADRNCESSGHTTHAHVFCGRTAARRDVATRHWRTDTDARLTETEANRSQVCDRDTWQRVSKVAPRRLHVYVRARRADVPRLQNVGEAILTQRVGEEAVALIPSWLLSIRNVAHTNARQLKGVGEPFTMLPRHPVHFRNLVGHPPERFLEPRDVAHGVEPTRNILDISALTQCAN